MASKNGDTENLWTKVTRSVKAYSSKKNPAVKVRSPAKQKTLKPQPTAKTILPKQSIKSQTLDSSTNKKLRNGKLKIESRLDLHGMSQEEAFNSLEKFINLAIKNNKRTLLIITGKGNKSEGILRKMLPLWLDSEPFKNHIIGISQAALKDGGLGAFYIRLKKSK